MVSVDVNPAVEEGMKCEQHKYHQYIICCVFYNTNNIITTRYTATATTKTSIRGL